ncbi:MAG TPA: hypothetical protein VD948_03265, partial [Rhodothermales bacterium]|nr:hypothetical protein [Rhodothermales bacterium]
MTQLGAPLPKQLRTIRTQIQRTLVRHDFELIDANRFTTGKDFLEKIWDLICSVPVGIAVLHEDMGARTTANIFYELGLMQAYGKETLIVKTEQAAIPSDFIRTEYVVYRTGFARKLRQFMGELEERARYYETVASGLD